MAASTGFVGLGTALKRGDGAGTEVFTSLNNVVNIDGPGMSVDFVEATHLGSTGGFREWRPHLKDGGAATITMHYDPDDAGQVALLADYAARVLRNFKIDMSGVADPPTLDTLNFAGYIGNRPVSFAVDDMVMLTLELRISGPVTESAA